MHSIGELGFVIVVNGCDICLWQISCNEIVYKLQFLSMKICFNYSTTFSFCILESNYVLSTYRSVYAKHEFEEIDSFIHEMYSFNGYYFIDTICEDKNVKK